MLWLVAVMGGCVAGLIGAGAYLELRPRSAPPARWLKGGLFANLALYVLASSSRGTGAAIASSPAS